MRIESPEGQRLMSTTTHSDLPGSHQSPVEKIVVDEGAQWISAATWVTRTTCT